MQVETLIYENKGNPFSTIFIADIYTFTRSITVLTSNLPNMEREHEVGRPAPLVHVPGDKCCVQELWCFTHSWSRHFHCLAQQGALAGTWRHIEVILSVEMDCNFLLYYQRSLNNSRYIFIENAENYFLPVEASVVAEAVLSLFPVDVSFVGSTTRPFWFECPSECGNVYKCS